MSKTSSEGGGLGVWLLLDNPSRALGMGLGGGGSSACGSLWLQSSP